ncbi:hypothetical protein [Paludifilum halophilum]|uniref:hypothetical protein n=1 Tax=Paludifilum halophilum TaxID=1642702 RepID=UPI001F0A3E5A|nr:hypothetical protein [Paludifilum halophilum]
MRTKGACWALLGPDVLMRETAYDAEAAAEAVRRSDVPYAEEFASHYLRPPVQGP